ncbi:MAG: adenylate/guanylate cyclase domain-containing protein [Dehalococcoidia bacterium]
MAEPRVQYAQTEDGVSIAYSTLGEGPTLVYMPAIPFSHMQLEWQTPEMRSWYERLAQKRRLVRFDSRGTGLSEHNLDVSLDGLVLDLEAVVGRLRLERFALFGVVHSGPVAIAYAARHPRQVSHLILWCSWARAGEIWRKPPAEAMRGLAEKDWELYSETMARVELGWGSEVEDARRLAAYLRELTTPEAYKVYVDAMGEFDVTNLLSQVQSPTIVFHRRKVALLEVDAASAMASQIPDASFVLLEGVSRLPWREDTDVVLAALDEFLDEGEEASATSELPEGMAVILFADIADSTALTEQLGDAAFREKARELDTSLRSIIRECGGTPVEGKVLGDGVLAVFTSARQAIEAALKCGTAGGSVELQLHFGIHAGDVIREGNNVYGGAVNIAARIAAASAPGEVLVSDIVRGLARTSAGAAFDDRGEHSLKGVSDPQHLFAVRGGGE